MSPAEAIGYVWVSVERLEVYVDLLSLGCKILVGWMEKDTCRRGYKCRYIVSPAESGSL